MYVLPCVQVHMYVCVLDWSSKNTLECPLYFLKQASVTSQFDLLIPLLSSECWTTGGLHAHLAFMWLLGSDSGPQLVQQAISQPNSSVFIMEG